MSETQQYIGVKIVDACPMDENEFNKEKDRDQVQNSREGYKVIYDNDYESWCPKAEFEKANRPTDGMPFGMAVEAMKKGHSVAREGWNGKEMYVFLVDGSKFEVSRAPLNKFFPEGTEVTYRPHMDMKAADGTIGVWVASQSDILEDDWFIVEADKSE